MGQRQRLHPFAPTGDFVCDVELCVFVLTCYSASVPVQIQSAVFMCVCVCVALIAGLFLAVVTVAQSF